MYNFGNSQNVLRMQRGNNECLVGSYYKQANYFQLQKEKGEHKYFMKFYIVVSSDYNVTRDAKAKIIHTFSKTCIIFTIYVDVLS